MAPGDGRPSSNASYGLSRVAYSLPSGQRVNPQSPLGALRRRRRALTSAPIGRAGSPALHGSARDSSDPCGKRALSLIAFPPSPASTKHRRSPAGGPSKRNGGGRADSGFDTSSS